MLRNLTHKCIKTDCAIDTRTLRCSWHTKSAYSVTRYYQVFASIIKGVSYQFVLKPPCGSKIVTTVSTDTPLHIWSYVWYGVNPGDLRFAFITHVQLTNGVFVSDLHHDPSHNYKHDKSHNSVEDVKWKLNLYFISVEWYIVQGRWACKKYKHE